MFADAILFFKKPRFTLLESYRIAETGNKVPSNLADPQERK